MRQPHKKKPSTGLSSFSVLEEGRDEWSTPTKDSTNDELPLTSIQVQKDFEHKIETSRQSDGWLDDRRRESWYPGN